eukprot:m.218478 g.218478  ORF g.218478 m.218478 type:complete len:370 (+) comp18683_c0_seq5:254-1363(+)
MASAGGGDGRKRATVTFDTGAAFFRQRLVFSLLSQRPCRITNIRATEDEPGLKDHEVSFLRLLDKITNGTHLDINHTGTTVRFRPGILCGGKLNHDCGSSRAVGYFIEGLLPILPFGKKPLTLWLKGVTNHDDDPSPDVLRSVLPGMFRLFGVEAGLELKVVKRGMPPNGGGEVMLRCEPVRSLKPVRLVDQGRIKRIRGVAYTTRVSPQTANRIVDSARGLLNKLLPDVYIYTDHYTGQESGRSPGFGLCLVAESTTGVLCTGEYVAKKGELPEDVGQRAVELLFEEISRGGCVDTQHQATCLALMVACPEDVSKVRVGKLSAFAIQHLRDLRAFFGVKFKIKADPETKTTLLSCMGIGYKNVNKKIG